MYCCILGTRCDYILDVGNGVEVEVVPKQWFTLVVDEVSFFFRKVLCLYSVLGAAYFFDDVVSGANGESDNNIFL